MFTRISKISSAVVLGLALISSTCAVAQTVGADGLIRVKSAYGMDETVSRIKKDIAGKGIMFFSEVDQSKLAANAGVKLHPSTLLTFGNPPLGVQFMTSKPEAGLDWPVRLLVYQNEKGEVWATYTDFTWIARRHGITDRAEVFKTATGVVESITSSVRGQ